MASIPLLNPRDIVRRESDHNKFLETSCYDLIEYLIFDPV